jgi:cytochrome c553
MVPAAPPPRANQSYVEGTRRALNILPKDFGKSRMRSLAVGTILFALAATSAVAQSVSDRLAPCLACHGDKGQSETPDVPSLGAMPSFYVMVQLYMFRERMRAVEPMTTMLQGVSDDDLRKMADAIAALPAPQPTAEPADLARIVRARTLIQQNRCNICHLPNFAGIENVPRLAGQREDYLLKSLRGYKDNSRRGYDAQMADVVSTIPDADFVDMAHFLARQK